MDYDVHTDLNPEQLTIIGRIIFNKWLAFALGQEAIGGHSLDNPSGKMASSIKMVKVTPTLIQITASSPEANLQETGHKPVDMLKYLTPGKIYPIHGTTGKASKNPKIWAKRRTLHGAAITPANPGQRKASNTSGTGPGWTIPAMPAYSPAKILAEMIQASFPSK